MVFVSKTIIKNKLKEYIDVKYKWSKIVFKYGKVQTQRLENSFLQAEPTVRLFCVKPKRFCKSLWSNPVKSFLFLCRYV